MRIAVVDLVSLDGGGYQITQSLFRYASSGQEKLIEWLFIVSKQNFESNKFVKVVKYPKGSEGYFKRILTEIGEVNSCLKKFNADVIVSMQNMRVIGCKLDQVIYLQQSIPFQKEKKFSFLKKEERGYAFRQYIQGMIIKNDLKRAKAILVQTEWVRKAVQEISGTVPVVNIGYPVAEDREKVQYKAQRVGKNFFYPCGPAIYKNITVIVKAVNLLIKKGYSFRFYITLTQDEMEKLTDERPLNKQVFQYLGRIKPEKVEEMYLKTTLVFASYIETLGLPLVEARSSGTWVIASDCSFSHELLDDYPNKDYFKPFDEIDLMKKMEAILTENRILKKYNSSKSTALCWEKMIEELKSKG